MVNVCTSTINCKIRYPVIFSDFFKSVAVILSHIAIHQILYYYHLLFIYKLFFCEIEKQQMLHLFSLHEYCIYLAIAAALDNVQHSGLKSSVKVQF